VRIRCEYTPLSALGCLCLSLWGVCVKFVIACYLTRKSRACVRMCGRVRRRKWRASSKSCSRLTTGVSRTIRGIRGWLGGWREGERRKESRDGRGMGTPWCGGPQGGMRWRVRRRDRGVQAHKSSSSSSPLRFCFGFSSPRADVTQGCILIHHPPPPPPPLRVSVLCLPTDIHSLLVNKLSSSSSSSSGSSSFTVSAPE